MSPFQHLCCILHFYFGICYKPPNAFLLLIVLVSYDCLTNYRRLNDFKQHRFIYYVTVMKVRSVEIGLSKLKCWN